MYSRSSGADSMFAAMTDRSTCENSTRTATSMSIVGEQVWLVMVTTEPAEEELGNPSLTGYFVHATAEVLHKGCGKLSPKSGATP